MAKEQNTPCVMLEACGLAGEANAFIVTLLAETRRAIARTVPISDPSATFHIAFPADAVRMIQNVMQAQKDACDVRI